VDTDPGTGDAVPSTFHPALVGREAPMADLADTVRRLIHLVVTNTAPADVLDSVLADLRAAETKLAAQVPDVPPPRFFAPNEAGVPATPTSAMRGAMPYDFVVGRFNPLALPIELWFEPPQARGRAKFTTPYEGGPGWVHGAAIAAAFDIVLTAANQLAGAAGPTVWLHIRYRRPTLIDLEARFEAEVVTATSRRVTSRGRLIQDGLVCVEAEGEFVPISAHVINRRAREARGRSAAGGEA